MAELVVLDPSEDMVVAHYSHSRHYMVVAMVVVGLKSEHGCISEQIT